MHNMFFHIEQLIIYNIHKIKIARPTIFNTILILNKLVMKLGWGPEPAAPF